LKRRKLLLDGVDAARPVFLTRAAMVVVVP
jgi:hypothetical protein